MAGKQRSISLQTTLPGPISTDLSMFITFLVLVTGFDSTSEVVFLSAYVNVLFRLTQVDVFTGTAKLSPLFISDLSFVVF